MAARDQTDVNGTAPVQETVCPLFWGKSAPEESGGCGHSLLPHLLDVAAVARVLLERFIPPPALQEFRAEVLAALAGLHDYGKAIPGFQAKWRQGRARLETAGFSFRPPQALTQDRHDLATAALLPREAHLAEALACILGGHHGYLVRLGERKGAAPKCEAPEWREARRALMQSYLAAQGLTEAALPDGEALETRLDAALWLAGLVSVADWIGSNDAFFPYAGRPPPGPAYWQDAQERAARALQELGWRETVTLLQDEHEGTAALLSRMTGKALAPRPLQSAVEELLRGIAEPPLVLIEAPMGEGKTEAAFLAFLRLQRRFGLRGFYIGLPTQATGNAMFERAVRFLQAFADQHDVQLDIQLAHAGAELVESYQALRGVYGEPGEHVAAASWFAKPKRALLSPFGVGTVDQALYAVLHVKHHFVRLWGLASRVVILDEVHAYDVYTGGLIEKLLRWLKRMGCAVILLSATLPRAKRQELLAAWGVAENEETAYPRLLLAEGGRISSRTIIAREQAPIALRALSESLEAIAEAVRNLTAEGGCIAVIVNTVDRAQTLYSMLEDTVGDAAEVLLYHARFPADQRQAIEQKVLAHFGKECARPERAILIATQVAEQSLDVDFDAMITDLAPVDLVLQRAGRLHRHPRQRPEAHREPVLYVAGLDGDGPPDLDATRWKYVYQPYILLRTWQQLRARQNLRLPQDIDPLVQTVYDDGPMDDFVDPSIAESQDKAYGQYLADQQEMRQRMKNVALDAGAPDLFALIDTPQAREAGEGGLEVVTRLGEASLAVVPLWADARGWRERSDAPPFDPQRSLDRDRARAVYARQLRVSRKALIEAVKAQPKPPAFAESPYLRDLYPLILDDESKTMAGNLQVRLDPCLGLVYEKEET